jgi:2-polyprenyl-6-methoxyphenol hydroxylase-like FAD-dependent oxidoreductase
MGGSVGGLCAGIVLRGIGCAVNIYERSTGPMTSRGAGILVQHELTALLRAHGAPALPMTRTATRRYLLPDGGVQSETPMPQHFTSWDALHQTLRATFPREAYHLDAPVIDFTDDGRQVTVAFANREAATANLLVCADGARSESRQRLLPDVRRRYAGYIAWRGTLEESKAPAGIIDAFNDAFSFCDARSGGHILSYFIPGENAAVDEGQRRLNWVWYVHADEVTDLPILLRDTNGEQRDSSVPPGYVTTDLIDALNAAAGRELHPRFAQLVHATEEPFIQAIQDVIVPRMVFGRTCLLGDAAFVVRPHTAGATAKAAADASALGAALAEMDLAPGLAHWERRQLEFGTRLTQYGVSLGGRLAQEGHRAPMAPPVNTRPVNVVAKAKQDGD